MDRDVIPMSKAEGRSICRRSGWISDDPGVRGSGP